MVSVASQAFVSVQIKAAVKDDVRDQLTVSPVFSGASVVSHSPFLPPPSFAVISLQKQGYIFLARAEAAACQLLILFKQQLTEQKLTVKSPKLLMN